MPITINNKTAKGYNFQFMLFFSSRRRHTRCLSDWSSDVCSSDLHPAAGAGECHPGSGSARRPIRQWWLGLPHPGSQGPGIDPRLYRDRNPALGQRGGRLTENGGAGVPQYYLGYIKAHPGKLAEAEKLFQEVARNGDAKYASLSKLSLAQIFFADGRADQGEKVMRDLIANPTVFVSADQATISLARFLAPRKPAEARKLLDPLRTRQGNVGQAALTLLAEIPQP